MNDLNEPLASAPADRVDPMFLKMKDSCRRFGAVERTGENFGPWDRGPRISMRSSSTTWRIIKWVGKWLADAVLICTLGAMETQGDSQALEPLITALKDPDSSVRESAAVALGRSGDARAVEPLIASLKDQEPSVRAFSAASLGQLGDTRAVEPLLARSTDPFSVVRGSAAAALDQLGDARALKQLIARLNDQDASAAAELGKSGDARAVEPLMAWFVKDQDQGMAKFAGDALVKLGTLAVEPMLACLKYEDPRVRRSAAAILGRLGDARAVLPLIACLKDQKRAVRNSAADALGKLGKPAVEPLLACLKDQNLGVRASAIGALDALRDERAVEALAKILPDWNCRIKVGVSLKMFGRQPASEAEQIYLEICDSDGARLETHWEGTKKVLLADLESDNQRKIENAAYTFISLGAEEIVPRLISILDAHGDKEMAEAYLACGDNRLADAASLWAAAHGCKISDVTGYQAKWGRWSK